MQDFCSMARSCTTEPKRFHKSSRMKISTATLIGIRTTTSCRKEEGALQEEPFSKAVKNGRWEEWPQMQILSLRAHQAIGRERH